MSGTANPTYQKAFELAGLPPPHLAQAIETKVTETMQACAEIFRDSYPNLVRPTLSYDLRGHTAGQAFSNNTKQTYRIRLNCALLWDPEYQDDMVAQVVPHEVAHIVCAQVYGKKVGHGFEWKHLMRQLGLDATRT